MNGKVILEHFYLLQKKKDDEISSLWKSHFKLGQLITGKIGLHCLAAVMSNNMNLIHCNALIHFLVQSLNFRVQSRPTSFVANSHVTKIYAHKRLLPIGAE